MSTVTNRIRGEVRDSKSAHDYYMNSTVFATRRRLFNKNDWGDAQTVGVNLKRSGLSFHELQEDDFGIFLGEHPDGWVVGLIDVEGSRLTAAEVFPSLEALKQAWELD